MTVTVLLKDVISIPERAGTEDYVLKLTEGVGQGRLDATIDDYVVTDDLARAFNEALDTVAAALEVTARAEHRSCPVRLAPARATSWRCFTHCLATTRQHGQRPSCSPVIASHDAQLQGKKVLRLAFHFLDAESIEQCVLGGVRQPGRRSAPRRAAAGRAPERRTPRGRRGPCDVADG